MRKSGVIFGMLCLCLVNMAMATAADNGEPEVRAWFTWMQEDGTWHEWVESTKENKDILYNVELKIGQPIKCKIEVMPKKTGNLVFHLFEPRLSPAYDVIVGKEHEKPVIYTNIEENKSISYVWVLKPNGNWTGQAPINCYWEIEYGAGNQDSDSFAFANPIILAEEWQGKEDTSNGEEGENGDGGGIPSFEGCLAIFGMMVVYFAVRRKNGGKK